MRALTGLSRLFVENVAIEQNDRICMSSTNFYLKQFVGKIDCFEQLFVLFDQLNIIGSVNLD